MVVFLTSAPKTDCTSPNVKTPCTQNLFVSCGRTWGAKASVHLTYNTKYRVFRRKMRAPLPETEWVRVLVGRGLWGCVDWCIG